MSINIDMNGKVALVTGGSKGIGQAICARLADAGASVAFTWAPFEEEPIETRKLLQNAGVPYYDQSCDASDAKSTSKMMVKVISELGGLDYLVCNAGTIADGVIWKMSDDDWNKVISVNLGGTMNSIREFAKYARDNPQPRSIVCISSINGIRGKFGQTAYSASKAGIIGLAKSSAKDLGHWGVNVNVVAPGMVNTEMANSLPEYILNNAKAETLNDRIAEPIEIADATVFLLSDMSRHISGVVLPVDGGQLL